MLQALTRLKYSIFAARFSQQPQRRLPPAKSSSFFQCLRPSWKREHNFRQLDVRRQATTLRRLARQNRARRESCIHTKVWLEAMHFPWATFCQSTTTSDIFSTILFRRCRIRQPFRLAIAAHERSNSGSRPSLRSATKRGKCRRDMQLQSA